MKDADSAVRTWAALGMCIRGAAAVDGSRDALRALLTDPEPAPRIAAAWALGAHGGNDDLAAALPVLVELASRAGGDLLVSLQALTAIDALGAKAAPALDTLRKLPAKAAGRAGYCLAPLLEKIIGDLEKARGV